MRKSSQKMDRVLELYDTLLHAEGVYTKEEAEKYGVNAKSIQRDIADIRRYLHNQASLNGQEKNILWDKKKRGYFLREEDVTTLTSKEILALCKIVLESRALNIKEMDVLIDKLVEIKMAKEEQKYLKDLVLNERHHYIELQHGKQLLDVIWEIEEAIQKHKYLKIKYQKPQSNSPLEHRVQPVGLMFSEFYFYLIAFVGRSKTHEHEELSPTVFRVDRIEGYEILKEGFTIPYKERFEEGEFRKRIQFMYSGELRRIKFHYGGPSVEVIKDRIPTAEIVKSQNGGYDVRAEIFGKYGIDMWIRSQGDKVSDVCYI